MHAVGVFPRMVSPLRQLWTATTPVDPAMKDALERRWQELPDVVRTPAQTLGQFGLGCEGTHGVFPRCNLSCTPCYHSRDANRVEVDGAHTLRQVGEQMCFMREQRGPRAHAQLIGGEVSLLSADAHAEALLQMRANGREPMSMSNGDFGYDYLRDLVVTPRGTVRLRRVSFAAHFDSLMSGRRGIPRASSEVELNPYRRRFVEMFSRLRREHGVRSFLAHTMTITPANVDQIPDVIRACHGMGFGMFSFQPAAYIGDQRKWREGYRGLTGDQVWERIEEGAGRRLPFGALQVGDVRCNRTTFGFYVADRYFPIFDDQVGQDLRARDVLLRCFGGVTFGPGSLSLFLAKVARVVLTHPVVVPVGLGWAARMIRQIGPLRLVRHPRVRPVTFVMHSFMDAEQVKPAWDLLEQGRTSADPAVRASQERLRACSYLMAHPQTGALVPACVQHAVLDPAENCALVELLPRAREQEGSGA